MFLKIDRHRFEVVLEINLRVGSGETFRDLDLLQLWVAGSKTDALSISVDDMNSNQFRNWIAEIGLRQTLRMYDDALYTEFESEFKDRLQKLIEFANDDLQLRNVGGVRIGTTTGRSSEELNAQDGG